MSMTRIGLTVTAFLVVCALAFLGRRTLERLNLNPEQRQRTRNMMRYGLSLLFLVAATVIWAEVLTSAALVASGFAVAIVLFHKDLILSVLGWWLKTMSASFRIGDRVRIGAVRGDVIDSGVLATTLIEVDSSASHGLRTGNVVTVPNALLLTEPVINETRILAFEWHELEFEVGAGADWSQAEQVVLAAAEHEVSQYRSEVDAQLADMGEAFAFHPIHVAPRSFVVAEAEGRVRIQLRMVLPARRIRSTSDKVVRAFIKWRAESTNT